MTATGEFKESCGIMPIATFAALKVDEWEKMIDINIKGVLYGISAALPVFTKAKSGEQCSRSCEILQPVTSCCYACL